MKYFLIGCVFWGIVAAAIYAVRPSAVLSKQTVETIHRKNLFIIAFVAIVIILVCTLPMSLPPAWNGENPGHRNQYEVLAESILDGRIDLDYGDMDPRMLELDNPYDPALRSEAGIRFHHDHAYYNGKYYMYFGVVPVFLLFLPFRMITGTSLTTYHATQIFTALFIFGVFALLLLLSRKFFRKMSLSLYLALSVAVSMMSVWYITGTPAMYCTAIASGICMEIWSLFFFVKAVWDSSGERQSTCMGVLGSLFGALAFGCRPTIALANILAIPMFLCYIKGKKLNLKFVKQILIVFIPYVVIGSLLMVYNYARFENPFEFGQSYQLTWADQREYGNLLALFSLTSLTRVAKGLRESFVSFVPLGKSFPYIYYQSILLNFPLCIVAIVCLLKKDTRTLLKKNRLTGLTGMLLFCPVLITVLQSLQSPFIIERYRSDIYWLVGILVFILFGHFLETLTNKQNRVFGFIISLLAFATIFHSFLLWAVPNDCNFTQIFPEYLDKFEKVIRLGF